jgi:endonuclease YncB( thermonuclease family)
MRVDTLTNASAPRGHALPPPPGTVSRAFYLGECGRWAVLVTGGGSGDEAPGDPAPATVHVTRVVDGDTIEVDYQGYSEDVRYIGIHTRGFKTGTRRLSG